MILVALSTNDSLHVAPRLLPLMAPMMRLFRDIREACLLLKENTTQNMRGRVGLFNEKIRLPRVKNYSLLLEVTL